jgi:hypothetical protein
VILAEEFIAIVPRGKTAAYDPSVGLGVIGARVNGFNVYTFENAQHKAYAVITPGVSE